MQSGENGRKDRISWPVSACRATLFFLSFFQSPFFKLDGIRCFSSLEKTIAMLIKPFRKCLPLRMSRIVFFFWKSHAWSIIDFHDYPRYFECWKLEEEGLEKNNCLMTRKRNNRLRITIWKFMYIVFQPRESKLSRTCINFVCPWLHPKDWITVGTGWTHKPSQRLLLVRPHGWWIHAMLNNEISKGKRVRFDPCRGRWRG